jgi:hypothetical protein
VTSSTPPIVPEQYYQGRKGSGCVWGDRFRLADPRWADEPAAEPHPGSLRRPPRAPPHFAPRLILRPAVGRREGVIGWRGAVKPLTCARARMHRSVAASPASGCAGPST